jgi:hypothetical protein
LDDSHPPPIRIFSWRKLEELPNGVDGWSIFHQSEEIEARKERESGDPFPMENKEVERISHILGVYGSYWQADDNYQKQDEAEAGVNQARYPQDKEGIDDERYSFHFNSQF